MNFERLITPRRRVVLLSLVAGLAILWPGLVRTQSRADARRIEHVLGRPVVEGEVLVRLRSNTATARTQLQRDIDADDDQAIGSGGWRRVHSASRSAQDLLNALSSRADVLEVEPNYIVHTTVIPNEPNFSSMWGLQNLAHPGADIHATAAWNVSTGSTFNVAGVVDTGVDYTHPDLAANMWSAPAAFTVTVAGRSITCPAGTHGFNALAFAANNMVGACDPMDDAGHGTHTAGTVGAVGNNGVGVVGVNWTARIMALKFLDSTGSGNDGDAVNAIDFALQAKAAFAAGKLANVRVLSNSWGGTGNSSALGQAIDRSAAADVLFVAAAGNNGGNNDASPFYPASYGGANVVSVAASNETDALAGFSNYGATSVDLAAPGTNIASTLPGNRYDYLSGTSMATPHVAGAATLMLSVCELNTSQLKASILSGVDRLASLNGVVVSNGRLNVDAVVRSCPPLQRAPAVSLTSPVPGATYTSPGNIPLAVNVSGGSSIVKVEYYSGATLVGTVSGSPYRGTWANVAPGSYTLTAKVYDANGVWGVSVPVQFTVAALGGTSATFGSVDLSTQGNWRGVYGGDGYNVIGDTVNYPSYATVTPSGQSSWTWAASTADVRGLQKATGSGRIAATWYGGTFALDVNFLDGAPHTLGLYVVDWDSTSRRETLEIRDAATNAVLDTRQVSGFNGGQYWRWTVSGHVVVRVVGTAGVNAVVSGLFFDTGPTNQAPTVVLTSPADNATFAAPAAIVLTANASDSDGIGRVEFYETPAQGQPILIGQPVTTPSYQLTWSNVAAGSYTVTAKAFDLLGASQTSAPVHVTVTAGSTTSAAGFIGTDTTTQGNWRGVYGGDGYNVIGDTVNYPSYATVTPSGQSSWTWAASTADVRGLQKATGSGRIATTWYGGTFTLDVNFLDGAPHTLGLYVVDWDSTSRRETLEIRDAATNAVLDTRQVSGFNGGQYWRWTVSGHVVVRVVGTAGVNAVVSGLFFDAGPTNQAPMVVLTSPADNATFAAPAAIVLTANASDSDGIGRVEFYETPAQGQPILIGQPVTTPSYQLTWSNVAAGSYTVTAKAFDLLGASQTSAPVHVTVTAGSTTSAAGFIGTDTTTQGNWRGVYGGDGYNVIGDTVNYPSYATVTPSGQSSWTWAASTADVRGLQKATGSGRIAATWYGGTFTLDVNVLDGAPHTLGLYLVDWDTTSRRETLEIRDAATNAVLDTRQVSGFNGGQYWRWTVSGHVVVRVVGTAGVNAVVSGLFFDR